MYRGGSSKVNGFSLRCVRDSTGASINLPTVTTTSVSSITQTTATSGGEVTSDGGTTVTARGVRWNTTGNPTIADNLTSDGTGTSVFTSNLAGLSPNTPYFVRAYSTNSQGTAFGNEVPFSTLAQPSFACGTSTIVDYDGNTYNTVQIGNQCWMKENLKTTHYANGMAIPLVTDNTAWNNLSYTSKAYCYYNNSASNAAMYGALYTWAAAMNGSALSSANPSAVQGACPSGWHLPNDGEWTQLENFLGGSSVAGGTLNATILWNSPNTGATNSSGFTALPGGYCNFDGSFYYLGFHGIWWTATEDSSSGAWNRVLGYVDAYVILGSGTKDYGFSVRCVKD